MTARSARHTAFTIERTLEFKPAAVFQAWSDPAAKARWFIGPPGAWTQQSRELDFRIGGREQLRGLIKGGPVTSFDGQYYDIIENERIVYAYEMHLDATRISVSLATVQFAPIELGEGAGTRMLFTEQAVFLDAFDDAGSRERGSGLLMDQLVASVREP